MKVYNDREVHKFVKKIGWNVLTIKGDHIKYVKNGISMVIPFHVNRMLIQRLNKQFSLGMF